MPQVRVLRVEVTEVEGKKEESLRSKTAGSSLSGGKLSPKKTEPSQEVNEFGRGLLPETRKWIREEGKESLRSAFSRDFNKKGSILHGSRIKAFSEGTKDYLSNLEGKSIARAGAGFASVAAAGYSMYSNYQKTGFELSGASHAASMQDRKSQTGNALLQIGVAAVINPALAVPVVIGKLKQQVDANRVEIFNIKKSIITSEVLQRNLVKNIREKRF